MKLYPLIPLTYGSKSVKYKSIIQNDTNKYKDVFILVGFWVYVHCNLRSTTLLNTFLVTYYCWALICTLSASIVIVHSTVTFNWVNDSNLLNRAVVLLRQILPIHFRLIRPVDNR